MSRQPRSDEYRKARRYTAAAKRGLKKALEALPEMTAGEREALQEQIEEIRQVATSALTRQKEQRDDR